LAFSQSTLLVGVGVACANATDESANEAITAAMGSNFMWFSCGCSFPQRVMHHITTAGLNAPRPKCSPIIQRRSQECNMNAS
jgi:hypothetical protein